MNKKIKQKELTASEEKALTKIVIKIINDLEIKLPFSYKLIKEDVHGFDIIIRETVLGTINYLNMENILDLDNGK